jgi:hypothetical protein
LFFLGTSVREIPLSRVTGGHVALQIGDAFGAPFPQPNSNGGFGVSGTAGNGKRGCSATVKGRSENQSDPVVPIIASGQA